MNSMYLYFGTLGHSLYFFAVSFSTVTLSLLLGLLAFSIVALSIIHSSVIALLLLL